MPKQLPFNASADEESSFMVETETEILPLSAADPMFSDFKPDDYKAYVRFRICTAFPNLIGPEMHGRYFGFHPQVLANSFLSLLHQQTNLAHMLKAYGAYRDRIQGGIVAVGLGKGGKPWRPAGKIVIPDSVEEAPYMDVIAVLWKMAEGNKELLGKHVSAREKSSVSIEVGTTMGDLSVYNPTDKSIISIPDAVEQWPDLLTRNKKTGIQIGKVDGVQFGFAAGGADGKVPFRGVGYTPNPAEAKTARIVDLSAADGGELSFAASLVYEWEPGCDVSWKPVLYGSDAGRGTIREVVTEGEKTLHGMTKHASAADPLLVIKVHGKNLEVMRHASSVAKVA